MEGEILSAFILQKVPFFVNIKHYPNISGQAVMLTSAIIILFKTHGMSCATRVANNNLRNNFRANIFNVSNEISHTLPG